MRKFRIKNSEPESKPADVSLESGADGSVCVVVCNGQQSQVIAVLCDNGALRLPELNRDRAGKLGLQVATNGSIAQFLGKD